MAEQNPPVGQLFTHVYLRGGQPLQDSKTFRRRLGVLLSEHTQDPRCGSATKNRLVSYLRQETGLPIPWGPVYYGYNLEAFLVGIELKYLLNVITLIWRHFAITERSGFAFEWHQFVERSLKEEHLGYRLDEQCGVHYFVDEAFERNRVATLAQLGGERYAGVRDAFDAAFQYLDNTPPDTKAAVRSVFESIEILAKLMVRTDKLNRRLVENPLKDKALSLYADDVVAGRVVGGMFNSFADWVDAVHHYRHGQGQEEPVAPPIELAVYIISTGASFLRWLVEIDTKLQAQQAAG